MFAPMLAYKTPHPETQPQTVTAMEQNSIQALCAYTAYAQEVDETLIEKRVTAHFGIPTIAELASNDYDEAVRFLVDFQKAPLN